jgi:hypothetical protein
MRIIVNQETTEMLPTFPIPPLTAEEIDMVIQALNERMFALRRDAKRGATREYIEQYMELIAKFKIA